MVETRILLVGKRNSAYIWKMGTSGLAIDITRNSTAAAAGYRVLLELILMFPSRQIFFCFSTCFGAKPPPRNKKSPLTLFCFSLQLLHFMTNKIVHHDHNGRFACNFFHCDVMILS